MPYVPVTTWSKDGRSKVTTTPEDRKVRLSLSAHKRFVTAIDETETAIYRAALAYREVRDITEIGDTARYDIGQTCIDALYFGRRYLRTLSDQVRDNADLSETHRELLFDKIDLIRSQTADLI